VLHGLVVVDKPAGLTSHDVVAALRRRFGERRMGHAGTLDPGATGILLVGVGKVTRVLRFLTALPKTYEGEVVLGMETSTLDDSGDVVARHEMPGVTLNAAREVAAAQLTGPILQVPPMVSALHVDGRRLHELAREGIEVEREPRPVVVHRFDIDSTEDPMVLRITVECSSGTYVRSLAADLGRLLGGGAHLRRLRRTAVGSFGEQSALPADEAELLPPAEALRDYERVTVDDESVKLISHGRSLPLFEGRGPWAVLSPDGDLIAVYEATAGDTSERGAPAQARPAVVLVGG